MGAIEDFRRDCYRGLTSFAKLEHRIADSRLECGEKNEWWRETIADAAAKRRHVKARHGSAGRRSVEPSRDGTAPRTPRKAYRAGTAKNHTNNPNRIKVPTREKSVCSGWKWKYGFRLSRYLVANIRPPWHVLQVRLDVLSPSILPLFRSRGCVFFGTVLHHSHA